VIEDFRHDLPRVQVFATLSPLPGFRKWLEKALVESRPLLPEGDSAKLAEALGHPQAGTALNAALANPEWLSDARLAATLREPMLKLAARYLLREKSGDQPLDPVAHFHLNNGAQVNRLFWLADASPRGIRQSYGLMASYRYDLEKVEENHERFLHDGHIAAARRVQRLLA
jgi:malonyl-CoA decarboxylase